MKRVFLIFAIVFSIIPNLSLAKPTMGDMGYSKNPPEATTAVEGGIQFKQEVSAYTGSGGGSSGNGVNGNTIALPRRDGVFTSYKYMIPYGEKYSNSSDKTIENYWGNGPSGDLTGQSTIWYIEGAGYKIATDCGGGLNYYFVFEPPDNGRPQPPGR